MKRKIAISESKLHNIISKTIRNYVNERLAHPQICKMFYNFIGNLDNQTVSIVKDFIDGDDLIFRLWFCDKSEFKEIWYEYLERLSDLDSGQPIYIVKEKCKKPITRQDGSIIWDVCVASALL